MGRKYPSLEAVAGRFTDWQRPIRRGYRMRCCDCNLIHEMDFRVKGGRAEFRVARDNRATAAARRSAKEKK